MIRILHIVGTMNRGGQETFLMNLFRAINKEYVMFDFVVCTNERGDYDAEIEELGGKIFHISPKSKGIISNYQQLKKVIYENKYKIVERHTSSASVFLDLIAAKRGGAKKRIVHAHNTFDNHPFIHKICRPILNIYATDRFGCSEIAGKWLFGKKMFVVIPNAIDVSKFLYNEEIRKKQQKDLGIKTGQFVVGTVGRLSKQKNPEMILDIFAQIQKKEREALLIWVGTGELDIEIKNKINNLGLKNSVKMLGMRTDVNELYQVLDVFLFPSLYEGLPVTLVEAQAAGLPCFVSQEGICKEAKLTELVHFISLKKTSYYWSKEILKFKNNFKRKNMKADIMRANYEILKLANSMKNFYIS